MTIIKEHRRRELRKRVNTKRATRLGLHERLDNFNL
jgi:hypothetical protein